MSSTPIIAPTPPKAPKAPEHKPEQKAAPAPGHHDAPARHPDAPKAPRKSDAPVRKLASNQHVRPSTDGSAANLVAAKEGAENEGMPPTSIDQNTMSDQPGAIRKDGVR